MWSNKYKGLILLLVLILGYVSLMGDNNEKKVLKVWMRFQPSSVDPMDYDLSEHHSAMRSVFASLVSMYHVGKIYPQVASSWKTSNDSKNWMLKIDDKWTFANHERVTPAIVLKNFKRIIILNNRSNSKSGVLEFLEGAEDLKDFNTEIKGLSITDDSIIFNFTKSMPDFLEKISFGLYGIAHPSDYNENGEWIDKKKGITSGLYRITDWSEGTFNLEVRPEMIKKNDIKVIRKVEFNFSKDFYETLKSDLMIREKFNPLINLDEWTFGSTRTENAITYVKVMKWDVTGSYFNNRSNRQRLRSLFYESLKEEGFNPTLSFFPLTIKNVKAFDYKATNIENFPNQTFSSQPYFYSVGVLPNGKKELGKIFENGFKSFTKKLNTSPVITEFPENESLEKQLFDIQFLGTAVLIDDPMDDIRFMFRSKEGIKLPDETGEILELLNHRDFDVQKVNQLLWDQAIIWPIRHSTTGFWIKNNSKIDLSELNTVMHPIDFQFVLWQ